MFSRYHLLGKTFSPKYYYGSQIDLFLFGNHKLYRSQVTHFCSINENYKHLSRRCLNNYGDEAKLEEHMSRCVEQELCNISNMHRNQKIKFYDWYLKVHQPMWIAADFVWMTVPLESANEKYSVGKLFVNKHFAVGYFVVKNPVYDNLWFEIDGYIK